MSLHETWKKGTDKKKENRSRLFLTLTSLPAKVHILFQPHTSGIVPALWRLFPCCHGDQGY